MPIVATAIGVEGMNLVHEKNVLEANTAEEFAMEIVRLYQDESLWGHLASHCAEAISPYQPDHIKKNLVTVLESLV